MAKQADVNRRGCTDSRVYPRPRKFPTSSTCGCLRVTKGYAHAIGSKVPEEIPTRSRKFVAPFAGVVGQTHEGRQHAWEKWDGNNRGVTAVWWGGGWRARAAWRETMRANNRREESAWREPGRWWYSTSLLRFTRNNHLWTYIYCKSSIRVKNNRSLMEIFNGKGNRIFSRNLKILLLEEGNSKIRVFVSIIEEFRKMEKLEREGNDDL